MGSTIVRLSAERSRLLRRHARVESPSSRSVRHDAWGVCDCDTAKRLRAIAVALADTYRRPPGRVDDGGCCVGCGRQVQPSPCCPDLPVWPGPCRSCYAYDAEDEAKREAERKVVEAAVKWCVANGGWIKSDEASTVPSHRLMAAVESYLAATRGEGR